MIFSSWNFFQNYLKKGVTMLSRPLTARMGYPKLEEGPIDFLFLEIITPKIDGKQMIKIHSKKISRSHFSHHCGLRLSGGTDG